MVRTALVDATDVSETGTRVDPAEISIPADRDGMRRRQQGAHRGAGW
jgi:hypothetical protein